MFGGGGSTPTPPQQSSASDVGRANYQKNITAYNQWYDDRYRKKKKKNGTGETLLERELTALLHARDLIEGALGTALERLADLERRLHALEGHPVPPRSALVPLDA